ncbi:MAG: hypothetical protein AB8B69_05575 [Chitinophagales bacterium]
MPIGIGTIRTAGAAATASVVPTVYKGILFFEQRSKEQERVEWSGLCEQDAQRSSIGGKDNGMELSGRCRGECRLWRLIFFEGEGEQELVDSEESFL